MTLTDRPGGRAAEPVVSEETVRHVEHTLAEDLAEPMAGPAHDHREGAGVRRGCSEMVELGLEVGGRRHGVHRSILPTGMPSALVISCCSA